MTQAIDVGGLTFSGTLTRTLTGQVGHSVTLPAGKSCIRTATGANTLATGHGLVAGNVIDVHWSDPTDGTHKCRRGITIDTANANDVTFDEVPAGVGDALPVDGTALVIAVQVIIDTDFDGDLIGMIAVLSPQRAIAVFWDASVVLLAQKLVANEVFAWVSGLGVTNPLAGNPVAQIKATNGSVTAATLKIGLVYQSN